MPVSLRGAGEPRRAWPRNSSAAPSMKTEARSITAAMAPVSRNTIPERTNQAELLSKASHQESASRGSGAWARDWSPSLHRSVRV